MRPPVFAVLRIRPTGKGRKINLWLPLFLIWILLLPLVLILLPFAIVAMTAKGIRPFHTLGALLRVLGSTAGTSVEVDRPGQLVHIHVF